MKKITRTVLYGGGGEREGLARKTSVVLIPGVAAQIHANYVFFFGA